MSCTKLELPPEPLTRVLPLPDPFLSVLCLQLNLLNPLRTKFLGTPLNSRIGLTTAIVCSLKLLLGLGTTVQIGYVQLTIWTT